MIIDSHCHLNYEPMTNSISDVVKRANENGVKYMLTISVDDKNYKNILDIVKKNKCVYGTYGIHPHEAKNYSNIKSNDIVSKIKMNKKIIGIGETGLDFYYNYSEKKDQISLFIEHIKAAIETKLPLIVHTRSAEDETYEILKKFSDNKNLKILIHCFTGSKKFADKLINIGSYISASGVVTFKKSNDLVATFKDIPIDPKNDLRLIKRRYVDLLELNKNSLFTEMFDFSKIKETLLNENYGDHDLWFLLRLFQILNYKNL